MPNFFIHSSIPGTASPCQEEIREHELRLATLFIFYLTFPGDLSGGRRRGLPGVLFQPAEEDQELGDDPVETGRDLPSQRELA